MAETTAAAEMTRWLHDDGLVRLTGVAGAHSYPIAAYTVDVATTKVTAYPTIGADSDSQVSTVTIEQLPAVAGTTRRLVVVGVTEAESILVVDLSVVTTISINGDRPERAARAWVLQLLLNSENSVTTNSAQVVIAASSRCRHTFIPGGGAIVTVDDTRPPVTTIVLGSADGGSDHLDLAVDGTAEMYLGTRFWPLQRVTSIDDTTWAALGDSLAVPTTAGHMREGN